ncbi:MAG: ATP-binding cassette domain-containing protein [Bacteroidetes bacterium]|nr:ATP-binding cassette domain-containing protein [Bacteroidota bacterium]
MKTIRPEPIIEDLIQTDNNETIVEITNLKKSFGKQEVLNNVSLKLNNGENLIVLGKSGCGKSVLIKCIIGLFNSDEGIIKVFNHDVTKLNRKKLGLLRQKVGFLFQSGALYDSLTVKQNLEFPLRRIKRDLTEKEIEAKVQEVLENVGLKETLHKMPSELSGGMRKRISLARTIILDPMLMLYDEPTTGLDPVTSGEISSLIIDVQKKYKTSSIIITHDIKCARYTANRVIMLHNGECYKEGKIEDFENANDPFIRSFFL